MIPSFLDNGYLPPGLHLATMEEVGQRFGSESEIRRVQFESITWLVDTACRVGIQRIVLNGSFVTDVLDPNDVDCVLLAGPFFPRDHAEEAGILEGLPFLEVSIVGQEDFDLLVGKFFATDRNAVPKGMVEVIL